MGNILLNIAAVNKETADFSFRTDDGGDILAYFSLKKVIKIA